MKSKKIRMLSALFLSILFFCLSTGIKLPIFVAATTHEGDIIISGSDVFTIENEDYVQRGNILVKDNAKLVVRNAFLRFDATYSYQYNLTITDSAGLIVDAGGMTSPYAFRLQTMQRANVTLQGGYNHAYFDARICAYDNSAITGNKVQLTGGLESHDNSTSLFEDSIVNGLSAGGRSRLVFRNTDHGIYVLCCENASVSLENVSGARIALVFGGNSNATFLSLRSTLYQYWSIDDNATSAGVGWNLTLRRTPVSAWAVYSQDSSVVTVKHADDLAAYASDSSMLVLEKVTLFENYFRDTASGVIRESRFYYFPLRATDNSSVSIQDCELGWIDVGGNASLNVMNSAKNPDIPFNSLTATATDSALALFQNVTIDYIDFIRSSQGVIKHSYVQSIGFDDCSTGVIINCRVDAILKAFKNASVFVQDCDLPRLYARDSAIVRGLASKIGYYQLTLLNNATLSLDHYLTLNVRLNNVPLWNANASVFFAGQEPAIVAGTTNIQGWVRFTLTGVVARSDGRKTLAYEIQVQYDKLVEKASNVELAESKNITIGLSDDIAPQISGLTWTPAGPSTEENVTVGVLVEDQETHICKVSLWFKTEEWRSLSMKFEGESWKGTIPRQANGTAVRFYVEACDFACNVARTEIHSYTVVVNAQKSDTENAPETGTGTDSETDIENGASEAFIIAAEALGQWWPWILLIAVGACIALALFLKKRRKDP
jgi:hypothetical protein